MVHKKCCFSLLVFKQNWLIFIFWNLCNLWFTIYILMIHTFLLGYIKKLVHKSILGYMEYLVHKTTPVSNTYFGSAKKAHKIWTSSKYRFAYGLWVSYTYRFIHNLLVSVFSRFTISYGFRWTVDSHIFQYSILYLDFKIFGSHNFLGINKTLRFTTTKLYWISSMATFTIFIWVLWIIRFIKFVWIS